MARPTQTPRRTRHSGQGDAKVLAAGGFLWRGDASGVARDREVAVVHRPKYDDWSLPKGKVDQGEQLVVTARREVCEETGATASCGQVVGEQRYRVANGMKYVRYWEMAYTGGDFAPQDEVDELRWLPTQAAVRKLSYDHDRQLAQRFADAPIATATLLLVRHANAGKKRRWKDDDKLRPLDTEGSAQAARLSVVAPCYGPVRIASADLVRCADTVRPVSHDLGIPISIEPKLGSSAYVTDPKATVDWVREQIEAGGTTLLCSQGEVIPDLLTRISARSPVRLRRPPTRKGSVWALSFAGGRLVGADYDADLSPAQTQ
jgi:8-oxo-dGTP pyrophosphatase MutT (NUDIX family)/phosphohistidine phosphatase SixA